MKNGIFILTLCCCLPSINVLASKTRLAIIDASLGKETDKKTLDLLCVKLSSTPSIDLLEREETQRILGEKNKLLDTVTADDIAIISKNLHAEALLLLNPIATPQKGKFCMRVRLIETRYGMKLLDTYTALSLGDLKFQRNMNDLIRQIKKGLSKLPINTNNQIFVGITNFTNESTNSGEDWIGNFIENGLEQTLIQQPNVLVFERQKANAVMDERFFSAALPDNLQSTSLLVHGTYRIAHEQNGRKITINILMQGGTEKQIHLTLPLAALKTAPQEITRIICSIPKRSPIANPLEANALIESAKSLSHLPEKAFHLAEAAVALNPESPCVNDFLILQASRVLWSLDASSRQDFHKMQRCLGSAMQSLNRIISKHPQKIGYLNKTSCYAWTSFYNALGQRFSSNDAKCLLRIAPELKPLEQFRYFDEFAYPALRRIALDHKDPIMLRRFIYNSRNTLHFSKSWKAALNRVEQRVNDTLILYDKRHLLVSEPLTDLLNLPRWSPVLSWRHQGKLKCEVENILKQKLDSEDERIAMMAATTFLSMWNTRTYAEYKGPTLRKAALTYCDFIIKYLRSNTQHPPAPDTVISFWNICFYSDESKDGEFKKSLYEKLLAPLMEKPELIERPNTRKYPLISAANLHTEKLLDYYLMEGDEKLALPLLRMAIKLEENLGHHRDVRCLKLKLNQLKGNNIPNYSKYLRKEQLFKNNPDEIVDLFIKHSKGRSINKHSIQLEAVHSNKHALYALFSLKADNAYPKMENKRISLAATYNLKKKKFTNLIITNWLPNKTFLPHASILVDSKLFVFTKPGNLIIFDFNTKSFKVKKYGNFIAGRIKTLTYLQEHIYALVTKGVDQTFLFDISLKNETINTTLSSRAKASPNILDGALIKALGADATRKKLLILAVFHSNNDIIEKSGLYLFSPKNLKTEKIIMNIPPYDKSQGAFAMYHDLDDFPQFSLFNNDSVYLFDKIQLKFSTLVRDSPQYPSKWIVPGIFFGDALLIPQGIILYGSNTSAYFLKNSKNTPIPFQNPLNNASFMNTPSGLIAQIYEGVFLLPNLGGKFSYADCHKGWCPKK
jgi:hypothetical protein